MSSSRAPNRPRRASASQRGTRTPPTPQNFLDFNALWSSRDLSRLTEIPMNERGWCGCRICGQPTVVKGSLFREHMLNIHAPVPAATKRPKPRPTSLPVPPRSTPSSPLVTFAPIDSPALIDLSSRPPTPPRPLSPTLGLQLSLMDIDLDDGAEGDDEFDAGDEEADPEGPVNVDAHEIESQELDRASREGEEEAQQLDELSRLVEMVQQESADPAAFATAINSPPPSPELSAPTVEQLAAVVRGLDVTPHNLPGRIDLITKWPHLLPRYLLPPFASGSKANPFASTQTDTASRSVFQTALPLLGHTLVGYHNASRRSVELVLRVSASLVWHTKVEMWDRFKRFYLNEHPDADAELLARMEEGLAPSLADDIGGSRTVKSALGKLEIDDSLIVHPVCRNHACNHVFYSIVDQRSFHLLPVLCPTCSTPTNDSKENTDVLHFPRRSLQVELEVLLRVPGVEEAIERRRQRKAARDQRDAGDGGLDGMKVYRQQDDGNAWEQRSNLNPALQDVLSLTVNLGVDWANPNSHKSAASSSMGPITLQVADLPPQLRASFTCSMLMGITPAPRQPSAENLWKFLLPLMLELRDAEINGVWVKTPTHPSGRLVKVRLGCIAADRPAAVEVTGGPYFGAHASPCLRCLVTQDQITSGGTFPYRSSIQHDLGIIRQVTTVPIALQADLEAYEKEPMRDPITGKKKYYRYSDARRARAIDEATPFKGHLSAVGLIPGIDKFRSALFDPMHSLLEGCCRIYFFKVMQTGSHGIPDEEAGSGGSTDGHSDNERRKSTLTSAKALLKELGTGQVQPRTQSEIDTLEKGLSTLAAKSKPKKKSRTKMTDDDIVELQRLIQTVSAPSFVQRLHPLFGSASAGTPSANDWRVFSTVYAPLVLPVLWAQRGTVSKALTPEELDAQMRLCEMVALAMRSSISERQIDELGIKISAWQAIVFRLHPSLVAATNLHIISHIPEDIRAYGPVYGWWNFLVERINHIIKSTNRSGGSHRQAQVVSMRAAVRSREVVSARARALDLRGSDESASTVEAELARELKTLFDSSSSDTAPLTLEQISAMYAEIDRQLLYGSVAYTQSTITATCKGRSRRATLGPYQLNKLQSCLAVYGQPTSLSARGSDPYLSPIVTDWEGMSFGGRRLSAAEWDESYGPSVDSLEAAALSGHRNSLFEARTPNLRYQCKDVQIRSGIVSRIFEHTLVNADGTSTTSLFAVIRRFRPFNGPDVYGYRRYPAMDIWSWEANTLEDSAVIALKSNTLDALRPLAMVSLPINPEDEEDSLAMWVTIPVHHH